MVVVAWTKSSEKEVKRAMLYYVKAAWKGFKNHTTSTTSFSLTFLDYNH